MAPGSRKGSGKVEVQTASGESEGKLMFDAFNLRTTRRGRRNPRWKAQRVGRRDWYLVEPSSVEDALDLFNEACEDMEAGKMRRTEKTLRRVLKVAPEHIDAMHHLAIILNETGKDEEALVLWTRGAEIGRAALPPAFRRGKDRLEWGWIENRGFLRCLEGLAQAHLERGWKEKALDLYEEISAYNPNDNQGVRECLVDLFFVLGRPAEAARLCERYPDDMLAGTTYGEPLALLQLGQRERASRSLKRAIKNLPLVAEELLKDRHKAVRSKVPGYITVRGEDQAYEYWRSYGGYWKGTPGALDWLRQVRRR